jgi:hypothetical protein
MRIVPVASLLIAAFVAAQAASGQSLAEAAAKEKERRKAAQAKAKVYTEGDLGKGGSSGTFSAPSGPDSTSAAPASDTSPKEGGAASPAGKKEKTPEELKAEQQKTWRDKLQKANDDITRISARIDTLQRAASDLSQNIYSASRTSQLNELEQAKKQLAETQQALTDLEDEGRRNGYR